VLSPRADTLVCSEVQGPKMLYNQPGDKGKDNTQILRPSELRVEDKQVILQDRTDVFLSVAECT